MRRSLLASFIVLAACNQHKSAEQGNEPRKPAVSEPAPAAFMSCNERGAHAEIIACKEDLATSAGEKVDRLFQLYREASAKLDGEYRKTFPGSQVKADDTFVVLAEASQEAWKTQIEKQCRFEESTSFGGSGGGDFGAECRLRLNSQRADELQLALELANRQLKP